MKRLVLCIYSIGANNLCCFSLIGQGVAVYDRTEDNVVCRDVN